MKILEKLKFSTVTPCCCHDPLVKWSIKVCSNLTLAWAPPGISTAKGLLFFLPFLLVALYLLTHFCFLGFWHRYSGVRLGWVWIPTVTFTTYINSGKLLILETSVQKNLISPTAHISNAYPRLLYKNSDFTEIICHKVAFRYGMNITITTWKHYIRFTWGNTYKI